MVEGSNETAEKVITNKAAIQIIKFLLTLSEVTKIAATDKK